MATPKKKVKDKKQVLIWKKNPDGGEYAIYKLGAIFRNKGKYRYRTSYKFYYPASSLAEAKRKIDSYSKEMFLRNHVVDKSKINKKVNKTK